MRIGDGLAVRRVSRIQLTKTIARYGRVDLLCIDELGYSDRLR